MGIRNVAVSLTATSPKPGELEQNDINRQTQLEQIAEALRALGTVPMTRDQADELAQRFCVHRSTIYRYRARLADIDEAIAVAGRTRGWKPFASRLTCEQEHAIEQTINELHMKPGHLRVVDLVEEVEARCRILGVACPSRPAIDRRLSFRRAKHALETSISMRMPAGSGCTSTP